MNKINFLEKKNITCIIIAIFVVFALIHLYKINSNTTEPFGVIAENSNVANGVFIDIPGLNQVRFSGTGLNTLLDNKANASALLDKADKSALQLKADESALQLKADVSALQLKADSNDVSALTTTVSGLSTNVTTLMNTPSLPEYTIIECFDETIPEGWQLCDGAPLKTINNNYVYIQRDNNSGTDNVLTPNLMKNFLLNPPLSERYHNSSYFQNDSTLNYIYQNSSLDNASESRWLCEFSKTPFMRIKLDKIYNVTGVWMQGVWGVNEGGRNVSILKVTGYNYPQLDIYTTDNDKFFRNKSINATDSNILVAPIIFKKNNTESIKGFDNVNEQFVSVMFDTPVKCNFLKIQPIKALSDTQYFNLRIGVIVKPANQYLIKKPKQ